AGALPRTSRRGGPLERCRSRRRPAPQPFCRGDVMAEITAGRRGDRVGWYRHRGRRYRSYSRAVGAGLVVNVVEGRIVGFGLEPCTDVVIDAPGRVVPRDGGRVTPLWAAPLAGVDAAGAVGAVATRVALRRRVA